MRQPKFDGGTPGEMSALDHALALMTQNEGFRGDVYYDSIGKRNTAGYGFTDKKDLHSWTEKAARARLRLMALNYDRILRDSSIGYTYATLSPRQQAALMDLYHQGGTNVLRKMPKFTALMLKGDVDGAFNEFMWGRINGKGTTARDDRRRSYFNPATNPARTVVPPINIDEEVYKSLIQYPDAIRSYKPLIVQPLTVLPTAVQELPIEDYIRRPNTFRLPSLLSLLFNSIM